VACSSSSTATDGGHAVESAQPPEEARNPRPFSVTTPPTKGPLWGETELRVGDPPSI
jgi:hypothetical protein